MNKIKLLLLPVLLSILFIACKNDTANESHTITSPSGEISVNFFLDNEGTPHYTVAHKEIMVIDTSSMGFEFKDAKPFKSGFELVQIEANEIEENWEMPWGEQRHVKNNYSESSFLLKETSNKKRSLSIIFRAYDDGIAFRYEFPEQEGIDSLIITDELSEFNLTADHTCWWIPGDWDIYEHLYSETKLSEINALDRKLQAMESGLAQTYIPENAVNTPITMRTESGLQLSFHEANLTDYAGMTLKVDSINLKLTSELVGSDRFRL
jgi:hypothetical protein